MGASQAAQYSRTHKKSRPNRSWGGLFLCSVLLSSGGRHERRVDRAARKTALGIARGHPADFRLHPVHTSLSGRVGAPLKVLIFSHGILPLACKLKELPLNRAIPWNLSNQN